MIKYSLLEYKEPLIVTIEIINTIRLESCCDEIRDEHLKMIFTELFDDIGYDISENDIDDGLSHLRKMILNDTSLIASDKINLLKKIQIISN